ncbi:MAG: cysteine desulfurase family protein [Byssovorax sp.]
MSDPVYLDCNASTPVLPRVRDAMIRALSEGFGNPSADHVYGRRARAFVDQARFEIAALLGCDGDEILFTGSGTESNNLALRGWAPDALPKRIITSAVEHPATTEPAALLGRDGATVIAVDVDRDGLIDLDGLKRALWRAKEDGPTIVSVILAQNETGVIQPIADVARIAKEHGALVHVDAAQAVGKIAVDVRALGVDLLSVAGHKLYAPKGVGALFVKRGVALSPLLLGAGHERGIRPGTENVAGIAALGEACAMAREDLAVESARQRGLRDRLEQRLAKAGFVLHGAGARRLPNTVNGRFPGVRGDELIARVPGVAFTTGSACHAGQMKASRVLTAMGIAAGDALGAIRLTLGRLTTEGEIESAAALLVAAARG